MNITDAAVKKLLTFRPIEESGYEHGLFVARKAGGCSGFQHTMGFAKPTALDAVRISMSGLVIGWPERDAEWFKTATLDFKDGLDGTGFTWENSAATSCCGCKKSFGC